MSRRSEMADGPVRADVLILGGEVIDGGGSEPFAADVADRGRQDHSRRQPRGMERGPHHTGRRPLRHPRVRRHAHTLGARAVHPRACPEPALPDPGRHHRGGRRRRLRLVAAARDDGGPRRQAGAPGHRHERRAHGGRGAGAPAGDGNGAPPSNRQPRWPP